MSKAGALEYTSRASVAGDPEPGDANKNKQVCGRVPKSVQRPERQAREVKTRARHTLALGDVLYSTWGYEQTNVDFYEVVAVRGACVDLRELRQNRNEHTIGMQGTCTARPVDYKGALIRGKRPNGNNWVRIESFAVACRWDGRPVNWSSYA